MTGFIERVKQIAHQLLEARARQLLLHVDGAVRARRDKGQVDLRLHHLRELDLGLFRGFLQALQRHFVFAEVDAVLFLEFVDQPVHDALVDVVAAEVGVTVGGLHFDHARANFQHGNIERAAAEVVHGDGFVALFFQAVGQRSRCGLVDDADDFEAGNFACLLGRLALRVIKIRGHRNHGFGDFFAEKIFRGGLQLAENHRGNLRRAINLAENVHARIVVLSLDDFVGDALHLIANFIVAAAHKALDRIHGVLGIRHSLAFRYLSHEALSAFGYGDNRRGGARAFLVGDHHWFAALHDGYDRVGGAQVNSYNLAHLSYSFRNPSTALAVRKVKNPGRAEVNGVLLGPVRGAVYNLSVSLSSFSLCLPKCLYFIILQDIMIEVLARSSDAEADRTGYLKNRPRAIAGLRNRNL